MALKTHCFDINTLRKEAYLTKMALSSSRLKASREHIANYMAGSIINPTRGMLAYQENINVTKTNNPAVVKVFPSFGCLLAIEPRVTNVVPVIIPKYPLNIVLGTTIVSVISAEFLVFS